MKLKAERIIILALAIMLVSSLTFGCKGETSDVQTPTQEAQEDDQEFISIGFSQLGAESNWRSANTASMRDTFTTENGYDFIFEDGQQKQSNQFTAIRRFIQQEVDYIVLAPVTETGWDTVLQEAKSAGIPVIIVDRMVNVEDENLFTAWVGSNFELEGKKTVEWLYQYCELHGIDAGDVHIADIQGTIGASAQIGRTNGLAEGAKAHGWDIVATVEGDFTELKGKEAMSKLLEQYDNINVVYCENDNEAFGVIEAIEAAGLTVGSNITDGEIMVISFDAVNEEAIEDVIAGKISVEGECNPDLGPRVEAIIKTLEEGYTPDKYTYVDESIYSAYPEITKISVDGAFYEVTIIK